MSAADDEYMAQQAHENRILAFQSFYMLIIDMFKPYQRQMSMMEAKAKADPKVRDLYEKYGITFESDPDE